MSRIGKKPIQIPEQVKIERRGAIVQVEGPKGVLSFTPHPCVTVEEGERAGAKELRVSVAHPNEANERALWGTARAELANMVQGVTKGYTKTLEINGIGYKVQQNGPSLVFHVGFSHPVEFHLPEGIACTVEKNTLTVSGIQKFLVGETAARIRAIKPPEPYKGKGIKYADEIIRRKVGKAAGKTE
jgi:large subunit ribosomal protein L6